MSDEFETLRNVRLAICDPIGYSDIISVDTLPETGTLKVLYRKTSDGSYWTYVPDIWQQIVPQLSDERITRFISLYGEQKALRYCLQSLLVIIGRQIDIVSHSAGAESTTFVALNDIYTFYKNMINDLQEDEAAEEGLDTGQYIRSCDPCIGGGV
jgi:hypothetical protein